MIKENKKEYLIIAVICILLTILDNSVVPFFSIKNACPSLLFTFAIAYSLVNVKEECVFIGIITGALQDIFFFNGFGINSLLNLLLCYFAARIGAGIVREKRTVPVVSMFFITILKYVGIFIIFYLLGVKADFMKSIITALYNSIIMFFMYKVLVNVYDDKYKTQQWRFK